MEDFSLCFCPRLHHAHLSARARSEASWPGVEGEWWRTGGLWRDGSAALPAVWCAVQNGHTAPGSHGHPRQPGWARSWTVRCRHCGHNQRGRHCVQRYHSGTAGHWLLQYCPPATQLARRKVGVGLVGGAGRGPGMEVAELVTWKQMRIHGGGVDRWRRNQVCVTSKNPKRNYFSGQVCCTDSINMSDFLLMCSFMFRPDSLMIMQDVKFINKHCVCRCQILHAPR